VEVEVKVLMAAGGSGGHITPALAVAEVLKNAISGVEICFAGSEKSLEVDLVPSAGYPLLALSAKAVVGTRGRGRLRAAVALGRALLKAREWLRQWRPDIVFATGGYVAPPVCLAARLMGIPVVIFEPNAVPGRANRWLARLAEEIHIGTAVVRSQLPRRDRVRLVGVPIRSQVLFGNRSRATRMYRLDPDRFTVLVLGGSQGAHTLNGLMVETLRELGENEEIQFVLQSGPSDYQWLLSEVRRLPVRTWVRPFIHYMGDALAVADLVVARAGAITLAELCATGRPMILVPYPYAADNHQEANARLLEEVGAAKVFRTEELSGLILAQEITRLAADRHELRAMGMMAHKMARFDAAEKVARRLAALVGVRWPAPRAQRPRSRRGGGR
jgi:UDP-N-acetylglucosamine--N-acetylmuramyl-(pentapeptide) pyrophosphoryl-undecaprenol N-acetylglucosamine transferase